LDRVAGSLNERCNDLTHLQIEADTGELTSLEERVKRDTVNMLREAESYSVPGHYIDGSRRLLDQPEFSQGSRARELVELVEEQVLLEGIICETPPDGDVVVYIGGENRQVSLRPFGVIFCQYGIPSQASGTICVIGPTRMGYTQAIGGVSFLSSFMSQLVLELYGGGDSSNWSIWGAIGVDVRKGRSHRKIWNC
jgi:heat-inducible transcriptional repressor